MIEKITSLFRRKPQPAAVNEPVGATVLFNAYCTLLEVPQPQFAHRLHNRRDLSDPELIEHLGRLCNHVFDLGEGQMTSMKYHTILHLQRVQHHIALSVGVDDVASLHAWALDANAILFTTESHLVDPAGRVLVNGVDGSHDPAAELPYPARALARKAGTEAALAARGINVVTTLPPLVCEDELILRDRDEVIGRARALLMVALRAESVASGEPMSVEHLQDRMPLADEYLSPLERAFLAKAEPTVQECAQMGWRYEALLVLEWAMGLVDELPFPSSASDAATIVSTMIEMRGPALRSASDILDALDLHYRVHWHIREFNLRKQGELGPVDADVVMERHHALNWLVRFQHAPWDQVDTPT